jgi:alkylation response protein AidB-like acyl-CoA dehydrogenase
MDFEYEDADLEFGGRLADWLREHLPQNWREAYPFGSPGWIDFQREWDRKLFAGGWAAGLWPVEYGGTPSSLGQRMIYADLMSLYGAPDGLGKVGKRLVAPVVMNYANDEQKDQYLPPILHGEEVWCQGFSEPGAGSDLGALRTRAVRDGECYVVSGQKVWTSFARSAQWCFMLVRTSDDLPKHAGISVLLVDMATPGIDLRPIKQINGAAEFNEVFLDNVVVPATQLVGAENQGWQIAMSLLAHERGVEMAFGVLSTTSDQYRTLAGALKTAGRAGDTAAALSLGRAVAESLATRVQAARLAMGAFDGLDRGGVSSALRLQATVAAGQGATESFLTAPIASLMATDDGYGLMREWLNSRSGTIAGGTAEIQRNTVARRLLGLK